MGKRKNEENFFKRKKVVIGFSIFSLVTGFFFLDANPGITGNVIVENDPGFNIISFIGLLLIVCSVILAVYSAKKK